MTEWAYDGFINGSDHGDRSARICLWETITGRDNLDRSPFFRRLDIQFSTSGPDNVNYF